MTRKDVEKKLHATVRDILMADGYEQSKDYICVKNIGDAVAWRVGGYLSDRKPPYAVF